MASALPPGFTWSDLEQYVGDDQRPRLIASCMVLLFLAFVSVVLRLVSRMMINAKLQTDDYLIVAVMVILSVM